MTPQAKAFFVAALAALALSWAQTGAEFVDLGGGLLMRADGSVVAAWDLPDAQSTGDLLDASDAVVAMRAPRDAMWQVRLERGW
jgi:hypothetical protein